MHAIATSYRTTWKLHVFWKVTLKNESKRALIMAGQLRFKVGFEPRVFPFQLV